MIEDTMKIESVNPEVLYQTDKAAVDSQVATAKQYPRNIRNSVEGAIEIVTTSDEFAATTSYNLMRDSKVITGPSVHLARVIAQQWGNMRTGSRVVSVNERDVVCEGYCWDLQNNYAVQVSVKRSLIDSHGKRYSQDMIVMTGNAGNAIAMRNAIFNVIPRPIVDKIYDAALSKITGDLTTEEKLIAKRVSIIKELIESYGISETEILASVGKQSKSHIGASEIGILIGMNQAIKDGDSTVKETFQSSRRKKSRTDHLRMARDLEMKIFKEHVEKIVTVSELNEIRAKSESDLEKIQICDEQYAFVSQTVKKPAARKPATKKPAAKKKGVARKKPSNSIKIEK